MTIFRWCSGRVSTACTIFCRCSRRAAASSGASSPGFLSGSTRSQSSSRTRSVPNARLLAVTQRVVGHTPHTLAVLLDERLERRHVAGATSLDVGGVVIVHRPLPSDPAPHRLDAGTPALIHAGARPGRGGPEQRL